VEGKTPRELDLEAAVKAIGAASGLARIGTVTIRLAPGPVQERLAMISTYARVLHTTWRWEHCEYVAAGVRGGLVIEVRYAPPPLLAPQPVTAAEQAPRELAGAAA
jgi:hypothetical protein